jgi:hypothetical protein
LFAGAVREVYYTVLAKISKDAFGIPMEHNTTE